MRRCQVPVVLIIWVALCTSITRAADTYQTGFEPPAFANGSQLLGQDGWSTAIPPFLNAAAAQITQQSVAEGLQAVRVRGGDLLDTTQFTDPSTGSPFSADTTAPYAAIGSYRYPLSIDTAALGQRVIQLRADVRVDGAITPDARRFAASLAARSANDGGYAELEIGSNGTVSLFTSLSGDAVKTEPLSLNTWHQLGIDVDYGHDTFTFLVDGTTIGSYPFDPANTSDTFARGALVTYALPDDANGPFHRANYSAGFDNFSIRAVPEPTGFGLLALGGLLGGIARRRGNAERQRKQIAEL